MKYCMIETAFDNKEELDKVITKLLKNKLVVSCQVIENSDKWIRKSTLLNLESSGTTYLNWIEEETK